MSNNGMIPGQEPYTPEEQLLLNKLLHDACDAEDLFGLDELEEYARQHDKDKEDSE